MKVTGFSRVSKDLIIKEIEKQFEGQPTVFVAQHGTTSATSLDKLRTKLRPSKSKYLVIKNSLGKRVLDKVKLGDLSNRLTGACGLVFSKGDPALSSKILVDFAKENEAFKIQAGYLNGQVVGADQIKVLASLPSREVLLARVAGGVQAPIWRFVGVLSGTLRKLVTVLDGIAKKK